MLNNSIDLTKDNELHIIGSERYNEVDAGEVETLMDYLSCVSPKKRVIVTGSDGFIGKRLVGRLSKDPNVILLKYDRKSGNEAREAIDVIKRGYIDVVFHLAAQTSVFNEDIGAIRRDNINLFIGIALACQKTNTKLVYASSSTANDGNTTSMYGLSKRFDEDFAKIYCPIATGLRFHNVYGGEPREGTLLWCLLNNPTTALYNNGKNVRCYTWVEDVVDAMLYAESSDEKLMNVVNEEPMTTMQFADIISKYYNIKYEPVNIIRKLDRDNQCVDHNIPKVPIMYHSVESAIKIIKNT